MRKMQTFALLLTILGIISTRAQTPPPGTISHPPAPLPVLNTNQSGQVPNATNYGTAQGNAGRQGNLNLTNSAGGVYSVDQLAGQLQTLRLVVDQTLPMLDAFTQTYSNSVGGPRTMGGTISGILSDVLHRSTNAAPASGQSSSTGTNLVSGLQQLLTTNAPAGAPVSPTKFEDVVALQQKLQSIPSLLQALNVGSNVTQFASPYSAPINPSQNRPLPTGR